MRSRALVVGFVSLAACGVEGTDEGCSYPEACEDLSTVAPPPAEEEQQTVEPVGGACGEVHVVDMRVEGQVIGMMGEALPGVEVWLEERAWNPGTIHGSAFTDAEGFYTFEAVGVPIVEDCWGWAALFHAVAEVGGMSNEYEVNTDVVHAWLDGSMIVDLDLQMEPVETEEEP